MNHGRLDELAFRSAAEVVDEGESLIVIDAAGCFDPMRMTHSARMGAVDPAGMMKHLHVLRARSAADLEFLIAQQVQFVLLQKFLLMMLNQNHLEFLLAKQVQQVLLELNRQFLELIPLEFLLERRVLRLDLAQHDIPGPEILNPVD